MEPGEDTIPLLDAISRRRSSRAFAATPLGHDIVETLIEAARWAPSYGNRQSWRFVVVSDSPVLTRLHEALTRGNAYAKAGPVIIALCGDPDDGQIVDGKQYYLMDAGLALENLLLQAIGMGLHAHPMGGFDEAVVRDVLAIPDTVRVLALVVVGYPGRLEDLDERTLERELRERTRKPRDEIRSFDRWDFDKAEAGTS
jgi:nitroreductase